MPAPTVPNTPSKGQIGVGSVIAIGPIASTVGTPVYVTIGEVMDAKYSGESKAVVKYNILENQYTQKLSGAIDAGTLDLSIVRVVTDAGQVALGAAAADATGVPYKFQVTLFINANDGQATTGDVVTFNAIVSKFNPIEDISPTKEITMSVTLELTTPLTIVAGS